MANGNGTVKNSSLLLHITDTDWNEMCDRRDRLDRDIDEALQRKSVRMAAIAINERAHLSASLKKAHNMREREKLATFRRQLDELKQELIAAGVVEEEEESEEEGVA